MTNETTRPALIARVASAGPRERARVGLAWMIGSLATVVSLSGSWIPSLWGDETASVMSAERSLPSLFTMLGHVDAVHGTYYFALHWWVAVVGSSPFALRFPSAVAVGLAAVAVVRLAQSLDRPRVAVVSGLVYCLIPRVTYMGEEARAYAFDAAIAAWLLVLLVGLARNPRAGRVQWALYGALLTLGIYSFLYMGLFVVAHAVVLGASRVSRATWRRWAIVMLCAVIAASPVIVFSLLERSQVAFLASRNTTGFQSLAVGVWFSNSWVAVVAWAFILVGAAAWVVRIRRAWLSPEAAARSRRPSLEIVTFAWLFVPGGLLLLSNVVVADFSSRYLSMSAPAAALAVALGIDRLATRRRGLLVGATIAMMAVCVPTYLAQRTPYAKNQSDWAEISATVGSHAHPGQAVVFDESTRPSRRPRLALHTYPSGFRGLTDVTLQTAYTDAATWHDTAMPVEQALHEGRLTGFDTVWLVEYATGSTPDTYGRPELLSAGYSVAATYRTHRSSIVELTKNP